MACSVEPFTPDYVAQRAGIPAEALYEAARLFAVECRRHDMVWTDQGLDLPEECRLPTLAELEGQPVLGDVRVAWSEAGLGFVATLAMALMGVALFGPAAGS